MRIFITGICGFVGTALASAIRERDSTIAIAGMDNFIRRGSETNRSVLAHLGVTVAHGDVRAASDFGSLEPADWIIDAAANPSVLAGVDGRTSSRQLVEHNLVGTINILETCRRWNAGFVLLSTSRVYSIRPLAGLPVRVANDAFTLCDDAAVPKGVSARGIDEHFGTAAPVSMYGATKLASEVLALEYGQAYGFPVWVDRCGVLAGAGQFGRADQGIFSYWIRAHRERRPLRYIGFDGAGHQVRDCLHPNDVARFVLAQMRGSGGQAAPGVTNLSGGAASATSLRQLTAWCDERFGAHAVASDPAPRPYDLPWVVLDSTLAQAAWDWRPEVGRYEIFEEIARHAEANPHWLDISG